MAKKGSKASGGKGGKTRRAADAATVSRGSAIVAALVAAGLAFVIGYVVGRGGEQGGDSPRGGDIADGPETKLYRVPVGDGPSKGPADALVTIVEWSDFECPHCGRGAKTMDQLFERFEGKVRLVFRHNPLSGHRNAQAAAEASLAAADQGRFWEYHDMLFQSREELGERGAVVLVDIARRLDLDMPRFERALESRQHRPRVLAPT